MKQRQKVQSKYDYDYLRMASKDSCDSDEGEETELFIRNKPQYKEVPTIEIVVEEDDTLQALSIRYHCPISELKRLNNIHKENEIFAKRIIKVPHRPFTMALAGVHISGTSSPNENTTVLKKEFDSDILNSKLNNVILPQPGSSRSCNGTNFNEVIFNSNIITNKHSDNDENIENVIDDNEEEIHLLPCSQELTEEPVVSHLSCNGADADISWITLIVCIIVVIFAVPLIYIFYIAEHPEVYQHHHHIS